LCCHSSAFPENKSSNFSPTPLKIKKTPPKKQNTPTHTTSLNHSHKKTIPYFSSLPFLFLSFPFLSFPFHFQQREQTEPLGSAKPTTPKPFQIAMPKTTLYYNLLFQTKREMKKKKKRHTLL
jgi:hypothetical protein